MVASAGILGLALTGFTSATAAPKPTVGQVQKQIEKLQEQAEQASEDYNETRERLRSVGVRLSAAKQKLKRQRAEVAVARAQVGRLAAETYKRGELSALDMVLGDDPASALASAGYLPSLGERQAGAMKRLREGESKLVATESEIKAQQNRAKAEQARLSKTKAAVQKKLQAANATLNGLEAGQRNTVRRALSPGMSSGGGSASCAGRAVNAPSGKAKAAIQFACAQIGDPYHWASAGPGSWDCSGLTMKAYAAAGVSLPHSSAMQAGYGTRVSSSNMMPGDLVFFHSPISHVGIYLGDGEMVHAPHSGDVVRVASLYATPTAVVRF